MPESLGPLETPIASFFKAFFIKLVLFRNYMNQEGSLSPSFAAGQKQEAINSCLNKPQRKLVNSEESSKKVICRS